MGSVLGGSNSWFAGGQVGRVNYQESDHSSTLAGLVAGAQFPIDQRWGVVICPVVEVGNEFGPNDTGPGAWKTSTLAVNGGVSVGLVAATMGAVQIVPAIGLVVSRTTVKVEYPTREVAAYRLSESDTLGQLDFGVGVVVNRWFSITPGWTAPFGRESHQSVAGPVTYVGSAFRIAVGVNLIR